MITSYKNIKSKYILKLITQYLTLKKSLLITRYNKDIQKELDLSLNDFISYTKIEIDIHIDPNLLSEEKNTFIHFDKKDKNLFNIFIQEDKFIPYHENYLNKEQNISIIKVIIEHDVTSLKDLFKNCSFIKEINFVKFNRENITDMSYMFCGCNNLTKLYLDNFKTNNVQKMNNMFYNCTSLEEINLNKSDTSNVTDMSFLFYNCNKISNLNLSNLNTTNVKEMSCMFGYVHGMR